MGITMAIMVVVLDPLPELGTDEGVGVGVGLTTEAFICMSLILRVLKYSLMLF